MEQDTIALKETSVPEPKHVGDFNWTAEQIVELIPSGYKAAMKTSFFPS